MFNSSIISYKMLVFYLTFHQFLDIYFQIVLYVSIKSILYIQEI